MKTLSIYTENYPEALERFFPVGEEEKLVLERGCANGVHYIYVCNRQSMRHKLQSLMEYIILSDNPALANSEKVLVNVSELVFRPTRGALKTRLAEFLKEVRFINVEGYISFRLSEYPERINAILYSIIKKNLYRS